MHDCRYQAFDAYSHSQVDLTGVSVVPHLTYISGQPTSQKTADVSPHGLGRTVSHLQSVCFVHNAC